MNEEELLENIFGEKVVWLGKYKVSWCDLCGTYIIGCLNPNCRGTTCNGGGCPECEFAHKDFMEAKRRPEAYLNEEEKTVYQKALRLKRLIKKSLFMGHKEIDWQAMETAGLLCGHDKTMFPEETKNLIPYK